MQQSNRPAKFLTPFAQNDSAKVEIPNTTSDASRASQSLGFPPLTGLPPEAGGVPPQLEDFNGAMNQIARGVWWALGGGRFPFDSTWANDAAVGGYALGALLPSADASGEWYSTADGNVFNPDTVGTNWVPGYHYGATALAGLTGGTVTLTPAQAAKRVLTLAGTLTSNLIIVVPAWRYSWTTYNNTGGAFTVTIKTAAGAGAVIPQNGAPTLILCDGTGCTLPAMNVGSATSPTQAARLDQMTGRLLRTSVYYLSGGVQTVIVDGAAPTTTGATTFTALSATTMVHVIAIGGGGGGGGTPAQTASTSSAAGGGASGASSESILTSGFASVPVVVGAAGAGGVGAAGGGNGSTTTFGGTTSASGGNGGAAGGSFTGAGVVVGGGGGASTGNVSSGQGAPGGNGIVLALNAVMSGVGGSSPQSGGGNPRASATGAGQNGLAGAGGSGAAGQASAAAQTGGSGGSGRVIVTEYA